MPRIHLTFPSWGATARDASGIPGSAKRSEAEEVFCLEFRFFCTFPRRAAPLPPLRGPPSPEEKVCSHPLKVSGKILDSSVVPQGTAPYYITELLIFVGKK